MPTDLAIRLTYHDKNLAELIGFNNLFNYIQAHCNAMFIVAHNYLAYGPGVRQHVHMAVSGCIYTQDAFRRKIKKYYNETHEVPLESTDLSIKKWDGGDKYLIYMIKGEEENIHPILHNFRKDGTQWISDERVKALREAWREGVCPQAENYKMWMAHQSFPKQPVLTWEQIGEANTPKLEFHDIVKSATKFVCSINGEWITAKHRFAIKDLVSNYCIRHGIKMCVFYI